MSTSQLQKVPRERSKVPTERPCATNAMHGEENHHCDLLCTAPMISHPKASHDCTFAILHIPSFHQRAAMTLIAILAFAAPEPSSPSSLSSSSVLPIPVSHLTLNDLGVGGQSVMQEAPSPLSLRMRPSTATTLAMRKARHGQLICSFLPPSPAPLLVVQARSPGNKCCTPSQPQRYLSQPRQSSRSMKLP